MFEVVKDRAALVAELEKAGAERVVARKSGCIVARKVDRGFALDKVSVADGHEEVRDAEVADTDTKWMFTRANSDGTPFLNADGTTNSWLAEEEVLVDRYESDSGRLEDGFFRPKGKPQTFVRCDRDITLMQPWGEDGALVAQDMRAGSWLNVTDGPEAMYGVGEAEFADTYDVIG